VASASLLTVIAAVVVVQGNIDPIRADMLASQGVAFGDEGSNALALDLMQQVTEIASDEPVYLPLKALVAIDAAAAAPSAAESDVLFDRAEEALAKAIDLAPLEPFYHVSMARYRTVRADGSTDIATGLALLEQASESYTAARFLRPNSPLLIREHASLLQSMGRGEDADELEERASTLEATP